MDLIVGYAGGYSGQAALGTSMAISAICCQGHPEGMILAAVLGREDPVTAITVSATALANGDGNQSACCPVTGSATAMLLGRSAHRYAACRSLRPSMAAGAIGGEANQGAVVLAGMLGREAAMAGVTTAAANVPGG